MISEYAAATLIYKTLVADSTLAGANYLTSTGRIFKSSTRPAGFADPAMTIRLIPADIKGEQKFKYEWLLWINLYLQNKSDLQPDHSRAGLIETRVNVLIDGKGFSDAAVQRLLVNHYLPGRSPIFDPDAPNEHAWQFQYYAEAS